MEGFDQRSWERATVWDGELPPPAAIWDALRGPSLPDVFREAVGGAARKRGVLRAGLAQSLASDGLADRELMDAIRAETGVGNTAAGMAALLGASTERAVWKIRFTNLVSGRFTELLFEEAFRERLADVGLDLIEETAHRNFLDYRIIERDGDFALAVNLKNAGVQYRDSAKWVGLEPEDTLPIATYKIFGSEVAAIPQLVYVYLVDWTLLERLRSAFWKALSEEERTAFRLLTSVRGLPREIEDAFIEGTVHERLRHFVDDVGYGGRDLEELPFRAISAGRCRRLFYDRHERSPYVYRQRMNTDPNVHISVKDETVPFGDFIERFLSTREARASLITELDRTTEVTIPAPGV